MKYRTIAQAARGGYMRQARTRSGGARSFLVALARQANRHAIRWGRLNPGAMPS